MLGMLRRSGAGRARPINGPSTATEGNRKVAADGGEHDERDTSSRGEAAEVGVSHDTAGERQTSLGAGAASSTSRLGEEVTAQPERAGHRATPPTERKHSDTVAAARPPQEGDDSKSPPQETSGTQGNTGRGETPQEKRRSGDDARQGAAAQETVLEFHEAETADVRERRPSTWSVWSSADGVRSSVVDIRDRLRPQVSTKMGKIRNKFQKFFTSVGDKMGNVIEGSAHSKLSPFQKEKLLHEFFVFFDRDKNGRLTFSDFCLLREHICQLSGWQEGSAKRRQAEHLFLHMWHDLRRLADTDHDDVITAQEWLLMWENIYKGLRDYFKQQKHAPTLSAAPIKSASVNSSSETDAEMTPLSSEPISEKQPGKTAPAEKNPWPEWVQAYLEYRFNLYDRTGDGVIDEEEFVYVLTDFGVRERFSRQAWKMFTLGTTEYVTFEYFCRLAEDYYLSDDPAAVGNFITGKLDFVAGEYANM